LEVVVYVPLVIFYHPLDLPQKEKDGELVVMLPHTAMDNMTKALYMLFACTHLTRKQNPITKAKVLLVHYLKAKITNKW